MITVKQAAHLQAAIDAYVSAETDASPYTALAYCANAPAHVVNTAKRKLRENQANRLHDLMMKEIASLTDWSSV